MTATPGPLDDARTLVQDARRVVVLTGAGMSTRSGIPDFRGQNGLWTKDPAAEKAAHISNYLADPEIRKARWRAAAASPYREAEPNAGHHALVELERSGRLLALLTQNVDGLHQRAGSDPSLVVEVHGTVREVSCLDCGERAPMERALARVAAGEDDPPCRSCGGILKSATISFGQSLVPDDLLRADDAARSCDLLLALGSTLAVYPIANVVPLAASHGARIVIVNDAPTEMDDLADAVLRGDLVDLLPALVAEALAGRDQVSGTEPRVGVVVVHYGTDELTLRSLRAVLDDEVSPPTRVVLVDNGPGAGVAERVRAELPAVEVVAPGRNTGFAGGCNLGIAALGAIELVALVNSDAVVTPGWLVPLVAALDADRALGAVVPKVRFEGRFHELLLESATTWRPGRGDGRELAWQPKAIEVDGVDVTDRAQLVEGFWEPGRGGRWAGPRAVLRVPEVPGATHVRVQLATPPGRAVELLVNGTTTVTVPAGSAWCELPLAGDPVVVLGNVGNVRRADGYGIDRGHLEVDRGQYDRPEEVEAWCGGAVLLRSAYLDDAGPFDERLFLYYEDLELGLRGAARGWRYRYEPASVVDHRHGASSASGSTLTERLKERNRLLVLARHGSLARLVRELVRFVAVTLSYVRREIVAPPLRGAAPCGWLVKVRGLALGGALLRLPGQLGSRLADARRRRGMPPLA